MRLFTAVVPPASVVAELADFVDPRRDADPAVRFVPADSWHVTTAFAGAASAGSLDRLVEGLTAVTARTEPFGVALAGAGSFPNPAQARVLVLAAGPADDLGRLAASCRRAFAHAGVEVDGARFTAHLTLARLRRPADVSRWLRVLDACPPQSWEASELLLIESHLNDRANRYEVVERFPFRGRDRWSPATDQP